LSTALIGTVYTYITWIHDKILDWPSSIPFINRLVLQLETYSYERRNLVKSLCEGFRRDTRSHHKAAKPLGLSAVAWSQSNTLLSSASKSAERSVKHYRTQEILSSCREGDADETIVVGEQRPVRDTADLGSRPHTTGS
jgi:hypothetical protein